MAKHIKVLVVGALGKMGIETARAIYNDPDLDLVGLIDIRARSEKFSELTGIKGVDMQVENELGSFLESNRIDAMIDFTNPEVVYKNIDLCLGKKINCVIGTTGLSDEELKTLDRKALDNQVGLAVIPNFAIGAVLMMKFAREAAAYMQDVEILELHHNQKMDSPSGTAIKTAEMIGEKLIRKPALNPHEFEKIKGARGADHDSIKIHSIRLPGLVAHQEVIFGGMGQTLTIRHDAYDRSGFMPGVVMVTKRILDIKGLVYGLDKLL